MQRDAVAQSNPSAEYSVSFDVFVCQIDPSNSTLIPGGRKARGAAKATSNVEKVIFCRKTKLIEKIYSGLTATDVELINRGKVINGYRVNRFILWCGQFAPTPRRSASILRLRAAAYACLTADASFEGR
jgi:hypothetical protein